MTDRYFVDTNVLVYARDASAPEKQQRATQWVKALWAARAGRLSTQVLNELYVTLTRKLKPGLEPKAAREEARDLMLWKPVPLTAAIIEAAWEIEDAYSVSYWDALIISAAQHSGSRFLLSEDLQQGQDFGGTRVVNPFRTPVPPELAPPG